MDSRRPNQTNRAIDLHCSKQQQPRQRECAPLRDADSVPVSDALPDAAEAVVLRLIAAGKSNREIADALVISINTVIRHVAHILEKKKGCANRADTVAYALRHRLAD
jgi:DNA-binding NarL/FixJ family response regulator